MSKLYFWNNNISNQLTILIGQIYVEIYLWHTVFISKLYFCTIKYLLSDSSSHHNCHNNIPWLWICLAHTVDVCSFFFYLKMCIQTMTWMRTKREGRVFNVFPLCWASATCRFQELSCANNAELLNPKERNVRYAELEHVWI